MQNTGKAAAFCVSLLSLKQCCCCSTCHKHFETTVRLKGYELGTLSPSKPICSIVMGRVVHSDMSSLDDYFLFEGKEKLFFVWFLSMICLPVTSNTKFILLSMSYDWSMRLRQRLRQARTCSTPWTREALSGIYIIWTYLFAVLYCTASSPAALPRHCLLYYVSLVFIFDTFPSQVLRVGRTIRLVQNFGRKGTGGTGSSPQEGLIF